MTLPANGRQRPASDHEPRKIGEVALVFDLGGEPWITARQAVARSGVDVRRLVRWVDEGVISCCQEAPGRARRYLGPEIDLIGEMGKGSRPSLRTVRQRMKERAAKSEGKRAESPTASLVPSDQLARSPDLDRPRPPTARRPGFPRIFKGRVAEVYGIPAYVDLGWMTSPFASRLLGVRQPTLNRWARGGVLSYRLDKPDEPFRYLRPELLAIARLREECGRLDRQAIEKHIAQKAGAGR